MPAIPTIPFDNIQGKSERRESDAGLSFPQRDDAARDEVPGQTGHLTLHQDDGRSLLLQPVNYRGMASPARSSSRSMANKPSSAQVFSTRIMSGRPWRIAFPCGSRNLVAHTIMPGTSVSLIS